MTTQIDTTWGPLSEDVHRDVQDERPWRDNGYLCFWDTSQDLFGALHVSTSPNVGGRRARITVHVGDQVDEIVEPVEPGTVSSESITFDFGDRFSVASDTITGELIWTPQFALADYTGEKAPAGFEFDAKAPLAHYQRAATVSGHLTVRGVRYEIDGAGVRDRTWGFRDESVNLRETIGFFWVFPDCAISAFRILLNNGSEVLQGYRMRPDSVDSITDFTVTRDAMGLFAGTSITFAEGETIDVRAVRRGGHYSPMGSQRTGPTHCAFDEFAALQRSDGVTGFGMTEQGVVRQIH